VDSKITLKISHFNPDRSEEESEQVEDFALGSRPPSPPEIPPQFRGGGIISGESGSEDSGSPKPTRKERVQLWTQNHFTVGGDPCDGCSVCLPSRETLVAVREFHNHARESQKWQDRFDREGERIATEVAKREKEQVQARAPIKRELEAEDRLRIQEAGVLRTIYSQQREALQRAYEEEYSQIKHKLNLGREEAKKRFDEEIAALNGRYEVLTGDIQTRLQTLKEEQARATEDFERAVRTELRVLQDQIFQNSKDLDKATEVAKQLCPHPSSETLTEILQNWPTLNGKAYPGTLCCRVCHKTFTYDQIVENVRRGGTTLAYSPIPSRRDGDGGASSTGGSNRGRRRGDGGTLGRRTPSPNPNPGSPTATSDPTRVLPYSDPHHDQSTASQAGKRARGWVFPMEPRSTPSESGEGPVEPGRDVKRVKSEVRDHSEPYSPLPTRGHPSSSHSDPPGEGTSERTNLGRGAGGDRGNESHSPSEGSEGC
jgi:hypothetical protein